jgi:YHS domain-containing protein
MMTVCPVCKTEIEDKKARGASEQDGKTYYFCCKACKKQFDETPDKYSTDK